METHHKWMQEALKVAESALNIREVPVGCVYVYRGKIIGKGYNHTNITLNGTRHSEFIGYDEIRNSYKDNFLEVLAETDLYVTVEPCIMCASLLRQLGIRRVFFGCANSRFGGNGSIFKVNKDGDGRTYMAYPGILGKEAVILLRKFYILENERSPTALSKRHRRLKLEEFPKMEYEKYLTKEEFTETLGAQYSHLYDTNDYLEDILPPTKRPRLL